MESSTLFLQYQPMILDRCYKFARKYDIDQDEVVSEGYLVFMEVIRKFDEKKAKFSTFLWINLHYHLEEFCSKQRHWENNIFETEEEFDNWLMDKFIAKNEFDTSTLSETAKNILYFIITRKWETPGKAPHKPSYSLVERTFVQRGMRKSDVFSAWNEIKIWWNCLVNIPTT